MAVAEAPGDRGSRRLLHLWIALVALLSGLDLSGCSVIGLVVGAAIDNGARHYVSQEPRRAPAIPVGAQIILLLTDSTRVSGRLEGSRRMPDEAYAPRYSAWREALPESERLPAFGEQIRLDVMDELPKAGLFRGFTYGRLRFESRGKSREVAIGRITRLRGAGDRVYPLEVMERYDRSERLPIFWQLRVETKSGGDWVDCERIAQLEVAVVPNNAKKYGFLIGALVDVAVIVAVLSDPFFHQP